jgi:DNA excision repair protein ERCC-2
MAPRFDADELRLELSVADLLERNLLRSLGFANRGGYERLWLGQAIHSRYQEQALAEDPTYQREVPLTATFPHRGWEVTVQGRADGLRRRPDGTVVVEEIKSVRRGGGPAPAVREIYQRQALLYAWMLRRSGEESVETELVLIEIGSESIEREALDLDFALVERAVQHRLNRLLRDFEHRRAAVAQRRAVAAELAFPYPELRPGQDEIVTEVETALIQGEQLLVEAPTGLGKTVAALYPAIRHALAEEKRLFVLTAKTLQQEMASEVLALLNRDESFHTLRLRAKAKMCANDQIICHEEYCPYARDYYAKLLGTKLVQRLLAAETHLLPDAVYEAARDAELCPFEVSLELSHQAQVVVGDYNYAFEPYVALSDFAPDADLSDVVLIIDEIHNLVERGRGYYSPELSAAQAREAADAMAAGDEPIHLRLAELGQRLAALVERAVDDGLEEAGAGARAAEAMLPEDSLWALRPEFDEAFVDYLEHRRETSSFRAEDPFVGLYFDLLRFLNGLVLSGGDEFSHCVERRGGARLRILCKDPSRFLGRVLGGVHAVVGLSATLSPGEFYRDLLGFDPDRARKISVPSPFPADNRRVVIDDTVATVWRQRPDNYAPIARRLGEFADAVPGNCLALFPTRWPHGWRSTRSES